MTISTIAAPFDGKLIIATSFYQQQSHSRYTGSLVATVAVLERLGAKWDFWPVSGDFHVERAINHILARFVADEEATDILLIDSDESWQVEAVARLLCHPEEVVGCAYRMKNRWEQYTVNLTRRDGVPVGKILADGTALLAADRLPGGFLRIKKSALLKFMAAYPDEWFWGKGADGPMKVPMFFATVLRDHEFFSGDFEFSERLKAAGCDLWCDPNAEISHYGMTEYVGNLDLKLRQDKKDVDAFSAIEGMAA